MRNIFDEVVDRKNTNSMKWDFCKEVFGKADILPMWVADMDFQSPSVIVEALVQRARHGVFGYTKASENLSASLSGWMKKRHNWQIEKDWIVYSPGIVTSIKTAILAYTNPGDKILIQTPVYHPFYSSIKNNERELITNPLKNNNGYYEIDFEDLEKKLAENNVKAMIFCTPHNPIGRVWRANELEEVLRLCKKYDVFIISDEIHSDLVFKGYKHIPTGLRDGDFKNYISLVSPTKTFNIAGLSISAAIIPDEGLRGKFVYALKKTGADMLNIFGLTAAEAAYTYCEDWLDELLLYLEGNLNMLEKFFKDNIPQIRVIRPEATYLAWLDCNELPVLPEKLNDFFVNEAGVGLNDGLIFGIEGSGFQRLNFACPKAVLSEGLEKIKKAVEKLVN
ncbi:MalY/PatB family protein [Acetivibrio saccincola]|jgi:cystathionine beta-lyase|uniref:cysteine-S-conjugate beta-lyase n=1 Tax=Acetivibrio saccincola TaxID=1677857 RepID=A0A2K9E734_9FIRM|nr:MalY/PatB family protein [Acetivibrio saccincola]AUG57316.1 Cystathionine beta-lyase PatB [Acetivibrio saccincola]NLW26192.1 pyridoxal phosphate-dependent aminotransferase [Acetivibrio saccincola]HOA96311.1 MalY/PatB family protein [Acetivibrio saccincola]HQD29171.1 MalY/PatB family protein [Acetivibrio saccincola]